MSKWQWLWLQLSRTLWVRATLIGFLGVAAAALAALADLFSPWTVPFDIGAGPVESILSILASSMLAVTTFSLSIMTSAYGSATSTVTPRATKLLVEDRVSQNVLSTFVGSFLFSIVGIVVLQAGIYGPQGRAVLFIVTIFVLALVVLALLRWIDHLTRLGRVGETTDRVEQATQTALEMRLADPYLGGRPLQRDLPDDSEKISATETGYVLHVDMDALTSCAEKLDSDIFIDAIPGTFVYRGTPLAAVKPAPAEEERQAEADRQAEALADQTDQGDDTSEQSPNPAEQAAREQEEKEKDARERKKREREACLQTIRKAFTLGDERSFDQDPRFGFSVLSEVASRALSPGINDPGTAIDVIGRMARLLSLWSAGSPQRSDDDIAHPRIHVPAVTTTDLFDDAFRLIARDGAALIEVQMRLRKTLRALGQLGDDDFTRAAREQADLAFKRAEQAMVLDEDRQRLQAIGFDDASTLPGEEVHRDLR